MKSFLKIIFITSLICFSQQIAFAQEAKTVTLVVSGQGKTQDEAKQNALRSAIEQAFGTFISSKTEILNDSLVKDEIVSVANGNIQKYEIISEVQIENGNYAASLKATVSVTKLTSFAESKGVAFEFKGSLFAFNLNQKELMKSNEVLAVKNMILVLNSILTNCFDAKINSIGNPVSNVGDNRNRYNETENSGKNWKIPIVVDLTYNNNVFAFKSYLFNTLKSLDIGKTEAEDVLKLGLTIYPISIANSGKEFDYFILRNIESSLLLRDFFYKKILNYNIPICVSSDDVSCVKIEKITNNEKIMPFKESNDQHYMWNDIIIKTNNGIIVISPIFFFKNNLVENDFQKFPYMENFRELIYETTYEDEHKYGRGIGGWDYWRQYSGVPYRMLFGHPRFVLKIDKKKFITIVYPYEKKGFNVGDVIDLTEMNVNKIFYTIYFNDYKTTEELKNISEYKIKHMK
jgi:hypothetical protein